MKFFTYGTLMNGEPRHKWLANYTAYYGRGKVTGLLYNFRDQYPVLRKVSPIMKEMHPELKDVTIGAYGEIYEVPSPNTATLFTILDEIEGVPFLFDRQTGLIIQTQDHNGSPVSDAFPGTFYVGVKPSFFKLPIIKSGDWRKRDEN